MQIKSLTYDSEKINRTNSNDTNPFSEYIFDIEIYPNYFLVAFKNVENESVVYFEKSPEADIDLDELSRFVYTNRLIGFNSTNFDLPILWGAILGYSIEELKDMSNDIISSERYNEKEWGALPELDHIDLIEVAPLQASLKLYGGRLHSKRMQDLPFPPERPLSAHQADLVRDYCINNDLESTLMLYKGLLPQIELRIAMGKQYSQDLRSKSDAQIAEAVIVQEVRRANGRMPKKPTVKDDQIIRYVAPKYVQFFDPKLREMLERVQSTNFKLRANGSIEDPFFSEGGLSVRIGNGVYRMGVGGLHSSETACYHESDENTFLIDRDVASYYPSIILNQGLYPKQLGVNFLDVYRGIVERRLAAKRAEDTVTANSLKITINGSFGKFGNKYSFLYSPDLLLAVTMTGQLSLLLLIEMLEYYGITVVSANTDGIIMKVRSSALSEANRVIAMWEEMTGFVTEETRYKAVYSRDVNNYIAIKQDGKVKGKGAFSIPSSPVEKLQKNPQRIICTEAVINFLKDKTPLSETIVRCDDFTKFVSVRTVKGGAHKDGWYLGKAIRWYYAKNVTGTINYIKSGNSVAESRGAKPCMQLPTKFPNDVNYEWYIEKAQSMLSDIGMGQLSLFS